MGRKQFLILLLQFGTLLIASRLPLAPRQLFSFDDVNLAYSIGSFDPRVSQPQPPGYPLFVLQMRLLFWLRFRNPQSILLALAFIGSLAGLLLLAWTGSRLFGPGVGVYAACLLLFHHSFWYGGLTSALRTQLVVISAGVAGACYRAWSGETRWLYWSAAMLGIGAGIRPEMAFLLFPLWAASAVRATSRWRDRVTAAALLLMVILVWLVPTMYATGGPEEYIRLAWSYLSDQAALTSKLFGASEQMWSATICWTIVWVLSGVAIWPGLLILAWRRGEGLGIARSQIGFLVLWLFPSLVFAICVHIADAGQALAMVPVICLITAYLMVRAAERMKQWIPREQAALMLFLPSLLLNMLVFWMPGWDSASPEGSENLKAQISRYIHTGLNQSSLSNIHDIAWADDIALGRLYQLATQRPDRIVVVWERGATSWRKTAYYFPGLEVVVLDPKTMNGFPAPVIQVMRGPRIEWRDQRPAPSPVHLPAGARVVWMVNPKTNFFRKLGETFTLARAGPLYWHDLPQLTGSRVVGNYLLTW